MHDAWAQLVKRYCPADRQVCNCGNAWYKWFTAEESGITRPRMVNGAVFHEKIASWRCQYGCQANQYTCRELIAKLILESLDGKPT